MAKESLTGRFHENMRVLRWDHDFHINIQYYTKEYLIFLPPKKNNIVNLPCWHIEFLSQANYFQHIWLGWIVSLTGASGSINAKYT